MELKNGLKNLRPIILKIIKFSAAFSAAVPVTREFFIDLFEGLFKDGDSIESSNTTLFTTSAYLTTTIFTTTASVDPCLSSPCQNNGTCSSSGQSFSCNCTQPYEGDNCEKFRPCNDSPCQNNATCWLKGKISRILFNLKQFWKRLYV